MNLEKRVKLANRYLKNNWYVESQFYDKFKREAGTDMNRRRFLQIMGLLATGLTIHEISSRLSVPIDEVEQVTEFMGRSQVPEVLPETSLSVPNTIPQNQPKAINTLDVAQTKKDIIRHETGGMRQNKLFVYYDSKNIPTIGIGLNLQEGRQKARLKKIGLDINQVLKGKQGLTTAQMWQLFNEDFNVALNDAKSFVSNFNSLHPDAQSIIVNMSFNMGLPTLNNFKNLRAALENPQGPDYQTAAKEMKDSPWYRQTGNRSKELVNRMQSVK
jgi:hypothetical protein